MTAKLKNETPCPHGHCHPEQSEGSRLIRFFALRAQNDTGLGNTSFTGSRPWFFRNNKNGITLTELLVASILIGIVMIGVVSFSVSIQQLQNSANRSTLLSMRTMTAMNRLTRDAYLAVGDETDRGIFIRDINPFKSICFRHDTNDPSSYGDDTYHCYLFETNNNNRRFSACPVKPDLTNVPPNNAAQCDGVVARNILLTMDPTFGDVFFQIHEDATNRLESIEFTLQSIFDPDPALTAHPITNPTYSITTRVSPPGISR